MAPIEHTILREGNTSIKASDGTRRLMEESSTTTIESSTFLTPKEEFSSTSIGCATLPSDPTPSCSEYFSSRIQSIMESRSEFGSTLESEIEASKDHWSELQAGNDEEGSAEKNLEVFRSLQQQYPNGFFFDWDDEFNEVGEKLAEGAQAAIYESRFVLPKYSHLNKKLVLKVFKKGSSLQDLQKQWPQGMLLKLANTSNSSPFYFREGSSIGGGVMFKDGRFAFQMYRCWGDLRKLIDLRMEHNGNQAPPFANDAAALLVMSIIARGMKGLHKANIVHRDLKASNVLVGLNSAIALDDFDPIHNDIFSPVVADFECSVGVVGTRFWRAPEILLGIKNRNIQSSLFTKESDVYSYAMTCYEVLTGKISLENLGPKDYDVVLQGVRPILPNGIEPWIKSLMSRCWHHDPHQRPSFEEIVEEFHSHGWL